MIIWHIFIFKKDGLKPAVRMNQHVPQPAFVQVLFHVLKRYLTWKYTVEYSPYLKKICGQKHDEC